MLQTSPAPEGATSQQSASDPDVSGYAGGGAVSLHSKAAWWIALLGFPASLTSPGATVSFGLVGLYGLFLLWGRRDMPQDLRLVHRLMLACYLLLLGVDVLNGGGWTNLTATGVNYLPLVALAPYAYALRSLRLGPAMFDRAMQATILLAIAISFARLVLLNEARPGGANLNPIPYGFVIAVWGMFLFSRGLATGRALSSALAGAALFPVFLTESKIAFICMLVGAFVVAVMWAAPQRRWWVFFTGLAGSSIVVAAGYYLALDNRMREFLDHVRLLFEEGTLVAGSFGYRFELALAGWRTFLEEPFLGYGLAQQMEAVRAHALPDGLDISGLGHLHNDYIAHMVAFGVFGLIFVVAYLAAVLWLIQRSGDAAYRRAGIALLVMVAVYMTSEIAFNMDPITGALTLALGAILSVPSRTDGSPSVDGKSTKKT